MLIKSYLPKSHLQVIHFAAFWSRCKILACEVRAYPESKISRQFLGLKVTQQSWLLLFASLRASSPVWASETGLMRMCERAAKARGAEERRAYNDPLQIFICTLPRQREIPLAEKWRSGDQSWLITGQAGTCFVCVSNLVLRGIRLVPRTCFSPQCRQARLM